MTQFGYIVTYRGQGVPLQDITDFVERIEITDVGSGEIRSCIMRLNAQDGQFLTKATQDGTNAATPIVSQFDMFEIDILDADLTQFKETFEVNILKPIQNTQQGLVLEVQMLGRESYLMKNTFTKQFRYASGFDVSRDIIDFYNDSVPKTLPVLNPTIVGNQEDSQSGGSNDLPKTTSNHYMFAVSELSHYAAMDQTVDKMAAPISSGGAGNFFEHHYKTDTIFTNLIFEGFESGNPPAQQVDPDNNDFNFDPSKAVIIDDSVAVNPGEEEGGIEAILATQVAVWGQDGVGMLPTENNQFSAEVEAWQRIPFHIVDEFYPAESIVQIDAGPDVQGDNEHYEALVDTVTTPPDPDWVGTIFSNFTKFSNAQYSKWTNTIADSWKNSCGNVTGPQGSSFNEFGNSTFGQISAWDGNLVVVDEEFKRSYADIRIVNLANVESRYTNNGRFYRGFRILVDTTLGTPVAPLDEFPNQLIQVQGHDSNGDEIWARVTDFKDDNFCAIDNEGNDAAFDSCRVYQLVSGVWTDVSQDNLIFPDGQSNDCYHPIWAVYNSQGFFNKEDFNSGQNYGINSAVTFEYRYLISDIIIGALSPFEFTNTNYYRTGAWANFKFPFPNNSANGQSIGSLYGNNPTKMEPSTLDQYNMHLTPSGNVGFNNDEAENLGVLDGLYFYTKFLWRSGWDTSTGHYLAANLKCRCFLYDTNDTIVSQDFTIPFNNLWEPISLPFSDFKIYRARKPASLSTQITDPFLQGLEVLDVFRYENIQRIAFEWLQPYDDQGRYHPAARLVELTGVGGGANGTENTVQWSFDFVGFSKAMLSVSPAIETGRLLQTNFFQEPLIDNKKILDQTTAANLDLTTFQHREYEIVTEGRFNIPYGYSFFLKNDEMIIDEDLEGTPNTLKLVNKKTKYIIDKPSTGPGGFLRHITGVKIIES